MKSVVRAVGLSLLVGDLGACSFEADAAATIEVNTCVLDEDCSVDARCEEGMCVTRSVDEPISVTLQVAPVRMPDGSSSLPMSLERFLLEGEGARSWELPRPVTMSGRIHQSGEPVEAEVRFTPASTIAGVTIAPIVVSTLEVDGTDDYAARLLDGIEYTMEVLPLQRALPPLRLQVTAESGARADVDYDALDLVERVFRVSGGPEGEALLVRAFDRESGLALSSSAPVVEGEVTLLLAPDPAPYRLEIEVEQQYAEAVAQRASSDGCDTSTPTHPTFSIDEEDVPKGSGGVGLIDLPTYPARIPYEGIVELCPDTDGDATGSDPESLPIDLHAIDLVLDGETDVRGSFVATTSASLDRGEWQFCVEVFPGNYEVVVTPPSGVGCAIFAEARVIEAPDGADAATGTLLAIPPSAYLSGMLQTESGTPVGGATIEAQALGRSGGVELAEDDLSVTRYNRSKQSTSDEEGAFRVPVDLGSYDVVVKPPAGSGYPWRVLHDVTIGARDVDFANVIEVGSPVLVEGALSYSDGSAAADATLEGAEVKAFAVIEDAFDTERAVEIGKTTCDADGKFMLLLSPSTRAGW